MISRFKQVASTLYRGSAPTPADVSFLHSKLGINKIVSLDQKSGTNINPICEVLNIDHHILPIELKRKQTLLDFLAQDRKELLLSGIPTFVHCLHGKDRTGLAIALCQVEYLNYTPQQAIKEAKQLGFGIRVDPNIIKLYEQIITKAKSRDKNDADAVETARETNNDDTFVGEAHQGSWAPFSSETKKFPMDQVYNPINNQFPTRDNTKEEPIITEFLQHLDLSHSPQVGIFDNEAGNQGFGPTVNMTGFLY